MAARIVLFGATGYTGRLTAQELARRGAKPVLAARRAEALDALASELGGGSRPRWPTSRGRRRCARSSSAATCSSRPSGRSCAGASPAVEAAIDAGAHYLDSTGEGPFIRARVRALRAGAPRRRAWRC